MNISLTQAVRRAAQQSPRRIACRDGARITRYGELVNRVARLAGMLAALGVAPGDRVAILALNADRYLEFYLAIWWAGAVANPVNTRWSVQEIAFSLRDCATRVLLHDDHHAPMVPQLKQLAPALTHELGPASMPDRGDADHAASVIEHTDPLEDRSVGGDALAGIFYTGGTTGTPKGVMLSHANLWSSVMARMAQVHSDEGLVVLHVAPLFHLATVGRLLSQLMLAGEGVFMRSFRPGELIAEIERHRVGEITLVPSMIQMLLDDADFAPERLASLKRISYGASPISEALLDRAVTAMPGVEFSQAYGQTEASPIITINPPESHFGEGRRLGRIKAAGRACLACEVRIEDAEGVELPRGKVGEICARGPNVMLGYWNRPEETAHTLRGGWLHTGDAGYMDADGFVYVVDRLKDMIVSGGENVYCAEVENAIASHPAVESCAVIGVPNERWGEAVHAAVVLHAGHSLTLEELQAHCRALIAGYKCPRSLEVRQTLPISPVGKVLKHALRQPFWRDAGRNVH